MAGLGLGLAGLTVAQKAMRLGILIAILAAVVGGVMLWGNAKYRSGKEDGIAETDAKWEAARERLRRQAEQSATRADDAAVKRLEEFEQQVQDERKAVSDAQARGDSPLDVLFGG